MVLNDLSQQNLPLFPGLGSNQLDENQSVKSGPESQQPCVKREFLQDSFISKQDTAHKHV